MKTFSLNGSWLVRPFDGQHGGPDKYVKPDADETLFYEATVPGEIHLDMMKAGLIGDVNVAMNAQSARWVEECMWVYRRKFDAPAEALKAQAVWLNFEGLDLQAVVYLNGEQVGWHDNCYTPCRVNVTGKLKECDNCLAVKIESGLFSVEDKSGTQYVPGSIDNKLHKRPWLRKPQYQFSWDWNPRLVNVGIWRPVSLEWSNSARIKSATVYPELADDHSRAKLHCRMLVENVTTSDIDATLRITCPEADVTLEEKVKLPPQTHWQNVALDIENPKLWWPLPHKEHPLYTLQIELVVNGEVVEKTTRRTGIRSIEIDQSPHPEGGRYFTLKVNGKPIFAKGGNWVPPDMIYARIDARRCRKLAEMAVEANFNTLRIWGGGLFADHALLEACDELGIMVWHDFLFACAKYPLDDVPFMNNVKVESEFAIRDLSHHPSLVLWSGNNEIEWGDWAWGYTQQKPYPHYALFHLMLPVTMKQEDPSRPYWPSSPYSPDFEFPNSKTEGDQHPWDVSLGLDEDNIWAYREDVSRFPNEGGVLGASTPATVRQFLPEDQRRIHSPAWVFHDNAMNFNHDPGICYRMVANWLGTIPENMDFDEYLFASTLMQSEGMKEYIDNFRRRMYSTSSAIFWMYNDSWPASHGWTIVDYYLRRKINFHPTRRAFQPITVIPAIEGENVLVFGVNETGREWHGEVRYGIARLAGGLPIDITREAAIPANSAVELARIPMADWQATGTKNAVAFALLLKDGQTIAQNRIFAEKFKDMNWAEPKIEVRRDGDFAVFSSPTFVWAACLDIDGDAVLPDNAFDILPGIEYRVAWPANKDLPEVVKYGNLI